MKNSSFFRTVARQSLAGKWGTAVFVTLVASTLGGINGFSVMLEGETLRELINYKNLNAIFVSLILSLLIGSVVAVGYSKFNLKIVDGKYASVGDLFSSFTTSSYSKIVLTNLIKYSIIFLLSFLFLIPGIVALYNYALTSYVMAENPDFTPKQALEKSKMMMYGSRFRLFCLEFSFIGWIILSLFTFGLGFLWLDPYMCTAKTAFYRELCDNDETEE